MIYALLLYRMRLSIICHAIHHGVREKEDIFQPFFFVVKEIFHLEEEMHLPTFFCLVVKEIFHLEKETKLL